MHKNILVTIVNLSFFDFFYMKSIHIFLKNLKNILPYLILIAIYFFFVNLQAKKELTKEKANKENGNLLHKKNKLDVNKSRIEIPVIPYKQ